MNIGPHKLDGKRCFIIAEAGTNHADSVLEERKDKALHYVERAKEFGADAVEFQIFSRDAVFGPLERGGAVLVGPRNDIQTSMIERRHQRGSISQPPPLSINERVNRAAAGHRHDPIDDAQRQTKRHDSLVPRSTDQSVKPPLE